MPQKGCPEWQKLITKDLGQISPLKGKDTVPGGRRSSWQDKNRRRHGGFAEHAAVHCRLREGPCLLAGSQPVVCSILQPCQSHLFIIEALSQVLSYFHMLSHHDDHVICDNFLSFSPIFIPYISFCFLAAVARTFRTMLEGSAEDILPDFTGKVQDFLQFLAINCCFFIDVLYQVKEVPLLRC